MMNTWVCRPGCVTGRVENGESVLPGEREGDGERKGTFRVSVTREADGIAGGKGKKRGADGRLVEIINEASA